MNTLKHKPITDLKGIGPKTADLLGKLGIFSYLDLLFHLPYRYQDRTSLSTIEGLKPGDIAIVEGKIIKKEFSRGRRPTLLIWIQEGDGAIALRFFNFNTGMIKRFDELKVLRAYGEVKYGFNHLEMSHPEILNFSQKNIEMEERLTPIYSLTSGISQRQMQGFINALLDEIETHYFPSLLHSPPLNLKDALYSLHKPEIGVDFKRLEAKDYPAQKLLALEEIVAYQIALKRSRRLARQERTHPVSLAKKEKQRFLQNLSFSLTGAQQRVTHEIENDLQSASPMMRLVQGDVGSGKTVVAAIALLHTIQSGFQAVFMAPTELLAEQHAKNIDAWFSPLGIETTLLTGKIGEKQKQKIQQRIASGEIKLIIGTHAVFQDNVHYQDLNLVIIDEQHRFGVEQRLSLQKKANHGFTPHQLMMTATPIPRTLAMTAYADLDSSLIDEYPPNRIPITTSLVNERKRDDVIQRIREKCLKGTQAYWVCTLIDESEMIPAKAAEKSYAYLQEQLPDLTIGLVHGRLKAHEKEAIMEAFKAHKLDILVATTVIEVGVDVPNASIMVIENAERLGLSQLHQLRGRVGRGSAASFCLLIYSAPLSPITKERLSIIQKSTNGFEIAEKDFKLRGAGEIFGTRQTGILQFKIADIQAHQDLIQDANALSNKILDNEPLCHQLVDRWIGKSSQFISS